MIQEMREDKHETNSRSCKILHYLKLNIFCACLCSLAWNEWEKTNDWKSCKKLKCGCFGRVSEIESECWGISIEPSWKQLKIVSETAYKKMSNIINGARRQKNSCPIKMLFLVCLTLQISFCRILEHPIRQRDNSFPFWKKIFFEASNNHLISSLC
jgi:hypothetical protein